MTPEQDYHSRLSPDSRNGVGGATGQPQRRWRRHRTTPTALAAPFTGQSRRRDSRLRLARAERAAEVARAEVEAARAGDSAVQTQVATALAAAAERI